MLVRVINGPDSIFEVELLISLSHDATLAAENEAAQITHNHAKILLETKFQVSMTSIMLIMVVFPLCISRMWANRRTDPWLAGIFSILCHSTFITSKLFIPKHCKLS